MVMPPGRAIVSPAFVGRAVAFEAFTQAYDRSGTGGGQTVLVSGEAGIGKSRFVAEARAYVEAAGGRFLQGNCFEQDRSLPFAPFADLIRTMLLPGSRSAALAWLPALLLARSPPSAVSRFPRARTSRRCSSTTTRASPSRSPGWTSPASLTPPT